MYFGNDYRRLGSDVVERDGEVAALKPTRHSFIPGMAVRNGKAVVFETPSEVSWIEALTEAIAERGGVEGFAFRKAVEKLLDVLGFSYEETVIYRMARMWIWDLLDLRVDLRAPDAGDRWANHRRYPRLSHYAQEFPGHFERFQIAMSKFVGLPDLASDNPPKPSSRSYTTSCYT